MKIEFIKDGKVFKNHRVMCEELGLTFKNNTNSKKSQLKELSCYCDWHKSGHSIVIDKVFEVAHKKVENRGKSSVYSDMVQALILHTLAKSKNKQIAISRNNLLYHINMINQNYGFCSINVGKLSRYLSIEEDVVYDFFNKSNGSLKGVIETAICNLEKDNIIKYERTFKVREMDNQNHREAKAEEKYIINACNKEILDKLGYSSISDVMMTRDWFEFKHESQKMIQKQANIAYYYNAYKLVLCDEYLNEDSLEEFILAEDQKVQLREQLNATVKEQFMLSAQKRHDKGFNSRKMSKHRMDTNYLKHMDTLIQLLIDDSQLDIHQAISEVDDYTIEGDLAREMEELSFGL
ncbi:hypothetical protein [Priestia filamentosa]|uniref:hypothetical protein n=1 Tax=Priestia filamentosa TaxID=1402861 RepID=UPI000A0870CC|nr:hypothetical protein [Priestia filamentosa]OXS67238.1 hypothetical protein B1B01_17250 [Priestia filamentosa]SMF53543.1 hypothetical protein SAMN06296056_104242 [Priestia filamentosa]